jgi:hypothetical protein
MPNFDVKGMIVGFVKEQDESQAEGNTKRLRTLNKEAYL